MRRKINTRQQYAIPLSEAELESLNDKYMARWSSWGDSWWQAAEQWDEWLEKSKLGWMYNPAKWGTKNLFDAAHTTYNSISKAAKDLYAEIEHRNWPMLEPVAELSKALDDITISNPGLRVSDVEERSIIGDKSRKYLVMLEDKQGNIYFDESGSGGFTGIIFVERVDAGGKLLPDSKDTIFYKNGQVIGFLPGAEGKTRLQQNFVALAKQTRGRAENDGIMVTSKPRKTLISPQRIPSPPGLPAAPPLLPPNSKPLKKTSHNLRPDMPPELRDPFNRVLESIRTGKQLKKTRDDKWYEGNFTKKDKTDKPAPVKEATLSDNPSAKNGNGQKLKTPAPTEQDRAARLAAQVAITSKLQKPKSYAQTRQEKLAPIQNIIVRIKQHDMVQLLSQLQEQVTSDPKDKNKLHIDEKIAGKTLLHYALECRNVAAVRQLIKMGASTETMTNSGLNARDLGLIKNSKGEWDIESAVSIPAWKQQLVESRKKAKRIDAPSPIQAKSGAKKGQDSPRQR